MFRNALHIDRDEDLELGLLLSGREYFEKREEFDRAERDEFVQALESNPRLSEPQPDGDLVNLDVCGFL